jgi:hypothetical protein
MLGLIVPLKSNAQIRWEVDQACRDQTVSIGLGRQAR